MRRHAFAVDSVFGRLAQRQSEEQGAALPDLGWRPRGGELACKFAILRISLANRLFQRPHVE